MEDKSAKEKVANYLTQMKELPEEVRETVRLPIKASKPKPVEDKTIVREIQEKETIKLPLPAKEAKIKEKEEPMPAESTIAQRRPLPDKKESEGIEDSEGNEKKKKVKLPFSAKDLILGVVNIITIFILVLLLIRVPKEGQELRKLRSGDAQTKGNASLQLSDIEMNKEKAEKLKALFLNDSGVVDFVKEIESLKPGGTVTKFSFASQKVVKDKTGNFGIPVVIDLKGTESQIGVDLDRIQNLPFLFRAINIEAEPSLEEEGIVELKYGGFLYVEDKLGEN